MTPPVDETHRKRIREGIDKGLFVEAGAGTGKTTALVGRILHMVASGISLRHIAAITFTNKAAGELRDRVRQRLEEEAADASSVAARALFETALDDLEAARIETIHGFAYRLLSEYPLQAGLPPALRLVDEFQGKVAFDTWWVDTLHVLLTDDDLQSAWQEALDAGLTTNKLKELASVFDENWHRITKPIDAEKILHGFYERILRDGRSLAARRIECTDKSDLYYSKLEQLAGWLDDFDEHRQAHPGTPFTQNLAINKVGGSVKKWETDSLPSIKDSVGAFKLSAESMASVVSFSQCAPVVNAVRLAIIELAASRKKTGALTFHDVLVLTRDLLLENREARLGIRESIQYLMIDEFQDTDPLQMEIASLIAAAENPSLPFDWKTEPSIEHNRLFFVGDPKQSIYRFRGADISVYRGVQAMFEADDALARISVNFRSQDGILRWVNDLFESLFAEEGQVPYSRLLSPLTQNHAAVLALGGPGEPGRTPEAMRAAEAEEIARTIVTAKAEGWEVRAGSGVSATRPACFEDMTILIPTRTCLPALERALTDANIPYRIESQSLLWATREASEILEGLTAISNPRDNIAVVATLRSSLFGCTDAEMLRFRQSGGSWNYTARVNDALPDTLIKQSLAALKKMHDVSDRFPINEVLDLLLRERQAMEAAFALRRPRDVWQRQRLLLDQARAFAASDGSTLTRFIDYIRAQKEEGVRTQEIVVSEDDDDAVRILTVHASKGLEFPIVFLAGLGTQSRRYEHPAASWNADGSIEISLSNIATSGVEDAKAAGKVQEKAEAMRLLYVAATRARDLLVVSLHHNEKAGKATQSSSAKTLHECIIANELSRHHTSAPRTLPLNASEAANPVLANSQTREAWIAELTDALRASGELPALAATTIARNRWAGNDEESAAAARHAGSRGRAGTAFGRAVHATLQVVDPARPADIEDYARLQAQAESIPEMADEIAVIVERTIQCPSLQAAQGHKLRREVYLSAFSAGIAVEGFLDLIYQNSDDDWIVVDYKTDRLSGPSAISDAMQRYNHQAAVYALLIRERLGKLPVRCEFLFVATDPVTMATVENLAEKVADLETYLASGNAINSEF